MLAALFVVVKAKMAVSSSHVLNYTPCANVFALDPPTQDSLYN